MGTYSLEQFRDDIRAFGARFQRIPPKGPILQKVLTSCQFIQQVDRLIDRLSPDERTNPALITQERVAALLADAPITADDVRSFRLVFKLFERMSLRDQPEE
jgi:hypothetical protein